MTDRAPETPTCPAGPGPQCVGEERPGPLVRCPRPWRPPSASLRAPGYTPSLPPPELPCAQPPSALAWIPARTTTERLQRPTWVRSPRLRMLG